MTEEEILALTSRNEENELAQVDVYGSSESGSESGSELSSGSESGSGSGSESGSGSDSESGSELAQVDTGLDEEEILALAQVESPNAAVKLTP